MNGVKVALGSRGKVVVHYYIISIILVLLSEQR